MASAKSDQPAGAEQGPKKRRRGGKPTGYKHSGTQRQLVGSEASDVRRAFLAALNEALPFAAFAELRSLAPSDVPRWADRWWIHALGVKGGAKLDHDGGGKLDHLAAGRSV